MTLLDVQHHRASLRDAEVHWVSAGSGETVLLLHGWPQTWYEWRHLIDGLAVDHHVVAPDLRGWGQSGRPAQGFDAQSVADDVVALVEHLGLGELTVVGHDWGVPVGLLFAAGQRARTRGLIAVEASIPGAGGERLLDFSQAWNPLWFFPFLATPDLPELLLAGHGAEFFGWMLTQMSRSTPGALSEADRGVYLDAYANPEAIRTTCAYYQQTWRSAEQIAAVALDPLTLPVLSVAGEKSLGDHLLEFVRVLAPAAEGVVLPGCGHLLPEERPTELLALVRTFLDKVEGRPAGEEVGQVQSGQ